MGLVERCRRRQGGAFLSLSLFRSLAETFPSCFGSLRSHSSRSSHSSTTRLATPRRPCRARTPSPLLLLPPLRPAPRSAPLESRRRMLRPPVQGNAKPTASIPPPLSRTRSLNRRRRRLRRSSPKSRVRARKAAAAGQTNRIRNESRRNRKKRKSRWMLSERWIRRRLRSVRLNSSRRWCSIRLLLPCFLRRVVSSCLNKLATSSPSFPTIGLFRLVQVFLVSSFGGSLDDADGAGRASAQGSELRGGPWTRSSP